MDIEQLFEIAEIDEVQEFRYFENMAAVMEYDEFIDHDVLYELFRELEPSIISELLEEFFEDASEGIPEEESQLALVFENIKGMLSGLVNNKEEERSTVLFVDELVRFRAWYNRDSEVLCINKKTREEKTVSLKEALVLYRMEKLNEDEYFYDFSQCEAYDIDEYVVTFNADDDYDDE